LKSADGYYTSNRGYLATEKNAAPSVAVTGVTLNKTTANLEVGATLELTATIKPANATNQLITWESSDPSVAVVSEEGFVTALAPGKVKITATSDNNKSAACNVSVSAYSISQTELNFDISETAATEKLTVSDGVAEVKNVTWISDDAAVATVDKTTGEVTLVAAGTTTIKASALATDQYEAGEAIYTLTVSAAQASAKTYTLTISSSDFNGTSYDANNTTKTSKAKATDGSEISVSWVSYQVMLQSNAMQWQKSKGYIYNTTDLGTIKSIKVNTTAGSFTQYIGASQKPTSNGSGGYFHIKTGSSAVGKTSSVVITFEK
jgi:hypothetical protein